MKTTAQLTYEKVRFDEAKDVHLVVSLAAPHQDATESRRPVCVIPVVDVSGSMQGEKLHFAKQSVMKLVDHLAPGDFCGVVVFSTQVETLAPPAEMTQARKDELKGLVGRLEPRHNTNLGGGLLAGLDHARVTRLPEGMLTRVILFTDGLANEGPAKSRAELLRLLDEDLGAATLSAFGYGEDADQELLREAIAFETYSAGRPVRGGETLAPEVRLVPAAEAQATATPSVDAVVAVAQLVRAQIDAEEAAARGNFGQAREVMTLFQAAVSRRGHAKVASTAGKLADRLSDADAYEGSGAYRSSMRKGGTRGVVTLYQREAHDDLESLGLGQTTGAQERMEESFGARPASTPRKGGTARPGASRGLARKRSRRW
jgi:hypothetical protein